MCAATSVDRRVNPASGAPTLCAAPASRHRDNAWRQGGRQGNFRAIADGEVPQGLTRKVHQMAQPARSGSAESDEESVTYER